MTERPFTPSGIASDRIRLSGISGRGFHGVFAHEKRDGQDFVVDVDLTLDLSRPGHTDELAHTVNYGEIGAAVVRRIEGDPVDLIEKLAEEIAGEILSTHRAVDAVTVTVHKPQAPVGVPFGDVEVCVHRDRRPVPVVIALGGNLGEVGAVLDEVVLHLADHVVSDASSSARFETDPVGGPKQPAYENRVLTGRTRLSAPSLLSALHRIEADYGRTRDVRWGARTLDLDLIQYGTPGGEDEWRSDDPLLTLPHPRAHERAFVLLPWMDADPQARVRVGSQILAVADLVDGMDLSGIRTVEDDG